MVSTLAWVCDVCTTLYRQECHNIGLWHARSNGKRQQIKDLITEMVKNKRAPVEFK